MKKKELKTIAKELRRQIDAMEIDADGPPRNILEAEEDFYETAKIVRVKEVVGIVHRLCDGTYAENGTKILNSILILAGLLFEIDLFHTYIGKRFGFNGIFNMPSDNNYIYVLYAIINCFYLKYKDNKFKYDIFYLKN